MAESFVFNNMSENVPNVALCKLVMSNYLSYHWLLMVSIETNMSFKLSEIRAQKYYFLQLFLFNIYILITKLMTK